MTGQSETESDSIEVKDLENIVEKKRVYKRRDFVCNVENCNQVFNRLYRLKRHLRQHTGERPFVCPKSACFRSFSCQTYLNKHLKRPHNIDIDSNEKNEKKETIDDKPTKKCRKEYVCNECQKSFKTKFQLRIHLYQHSGQKPFECHKCDKRFATKSKLKSHLKTHEGYACGREDCEFKACKWSELRKHMSVWHKVLKCGECEKRFNNSYNLNLHKQTIHLNSIEKIVCTYDNCNKTYSKKSNLMAHIRSQHNKQMFECTQDGCHKTFLHKKSLNRHLETHSKPESTQLNHSLRKTKNANKKYPKRVSKASELTGMELNEHQSKQLMDFDLKFRKKFGEK